jgi:hypothetical protein
MLVDNIKHNMLSTSNIFLYLILFRIYFIIYINISNIIIFISYALYYIIRLIFYVDIELKMYTLYYILRNFNDKSTESYIYFFNYFYQTSFKRKLSTFA